MSLFKETVLHMNLVLQGPWLMSRIKPNSSNSNPNISCTASYLTIQHQVLNLQ